MQKKNNYELRIYDETSKGDMYRYGVIHSIKMNDGEVVKIKGSNNLYSILPKTELVNIEVKYQKSDKEKYPDFLSIRFGLYCANKKARTFLKRMGIEHHSIKVNVVNETNKVGYEVIYFDQVNIIDLEKSNLEWKGSQLITTGKTYLSPIDSQIIPKENVKGIIQLKGYPGVILCDEKIKSALDQSQLTGFFFKGVSGNND